MLDQETITQQLALLAAHRRTLAHLLQQAAQYGGEVFAPPQTANGIAEARKEIQRIKVALREGGVQVENEPNDKTPRRRKPAQAQQAGDVISGDYAEGNIDKRQGAFIGGNVYGNVIGQQIVQGATTPLPALHQLRAPVGDFVGREREIDQLCTVS